MPLFVVDVAVCTVELGGVTVAANDGNDEVLVIFVVVDNNDDVDDDDVVVMDAAATPFVGPSSICICVVLV